MGRGEVTLSSPFLTYTALDFSRVPETLIRVSSTFPFYPALNVLLYAILELLVLVKVRGSPT